ncbi:MAG: Mrp/NBP35 family ATP-binding protein [Spirochaetales bacterium]|nr:Mrp/NBP35 family ATP-binding protein [Spirochaetales bacterium]MBR4427409.1 Mrp/NBP35 family ATP-binding protein [Spirochaetales bacterium]
MSQEIFMPNESELQEVNIHSRMALVDRKILIMSGKGGVGKSTVTVNLANALLAMGHTVGVLDTDIHGPNIPKMFGCEGAILQSNEDGTSILPVCPRPGLKVVSISFALNDPDQAIVFRGPMKLGTILQFLADVEWGTLDYLLIDSPPGTGDEQLAICQNVPDLTGCILVTTPQQVAILDAKKSVNFAWQLNTKVLGLVENMSYLTCPECGKHIPIFGTDGGKNLCEEMGIPFLGGIPMEIGLQQDEDLGLNWLEENPDSESAKAFMAIAKHLHETVEFKHTPYVPSFSSCSPSACASCTANCSSKKE